MKQLMLFNENADNRSEGVVLSASRMTDMPKYYPEELIAEIEKRREKGIQIHTLVLWTKHPQALVEGQLREYLSVLKQEGIQLFVECTITGMGGRRIGKENSTIVMEPNVPLCEVAIEQLSEVINLIGTPERIKLRIDPLIIIKNTKSQEVFTNLKYVKYIMKETSKLGINNYVFSFLERGTHKKVDKRFDSYDWKIQQLNRNEKKKIYKWLKEKANLYDINIQPCCVPGLKENRCIDGYLLEELHDEKKKTNTTEPRKRELCACTHSIDLGGWPPKRCYSGCKYCYANAHI